MPIISTYSKSIRWLLAELSVVVLGILIAFQVDGWREGNANREQERIALSALLLDLENERSSLNAFLEAARRQVVALSFLITLNEDERSSDENWVATQYRDAILTRLWQPVATTYEGLSSSGNMNLFSNQELLIALIDYYETKNSPLVQLINDMRSARDAFILVLGRDIYFRATNQLLDDTNSLEVNIVSPIADMPRHPDFYAYYGSYAYRISVLRLRLEDRLERNSELQSQIGDQMKALGN